MIECVLAKVLGKQMIAVMSEIRTEFELPVFGYTIWEGVDRELAFSETQKKLEGLLFSLPNFYYENIRAVEDLSYIELDKKQLRLEEKLSVHENNMLYSYNRTNCPVENFREARNFQLINLMFADKILSEISPQCFVGGRGSYLDNVIAGALAQRGVPTLIVGRARSMQDRLVGLDSYGKQLGMSEAFEKFLLGKSDNYDPALIEVADKRFTEFLQQPYQPEFVKILRRSFWRSLIQAASYLLGNFYKNIKAYRKNEFDRRFGILTSPIKSIMRWPIKGARMQLLERSGMLLKNPCLKRKFFYLPLHYSPEVTDLYYGRNYSHHEAFVYHLAKRIPSDCSLYVKEHTAMTGNRPLSFYRELKKTHNVEVIHPEVSTFDLIRHCSAVITVTGTAGWEGYLLNKPVIVLGDVFYNFLPGVLHADMWQPGFQEKLENYLSSFIPDIEERKAAFRASIVTSQVVGTGFEGYDFNDTNVDANAYAKALLNVFIDWGEILVESESLQHGK